MVRLEKLTGLVEKLYSANIGKDTRRAIIASWFWENHVKIVVRECESMCLKYADANRDLVIAGALLHDIADAVMWRFDPRHEEESVNIARKLMQEVDYAQEDIEFVLKELIATHGCGELMPTKVEGKILATADGMAHLVTDFYSYFCWMHEGKQEYEEFKKWTLETAERYYTRKIFFDDIRERIKPDYDSIRLLFSR